MLKEYKTNEVQSNFVKTLKLAVISSYLFNKEMQAPGLFLKSRHLLMTNKYYFHSQGATLGGLKANIFESSYCKSIRIHHILR